jgi:hypothetical protein
MVKKYVNKNWRTRQWNMFCRERTVGGRYLKQCILMGVNVKIIKNMKKIAHHAWP